MVRKTIQNRNNKGNYSEMTYYNWGYPTLFSQSQDKPRTKEPEFVNKQLNNDLPLTVIGWPMKEVQFFCSKLVL